MPTAPLRLDRILANLGYASRAEARGMVIAGRVTVAGEIVRDIGAKARAEDVTVDGAALEFPGGVLIGLHKPIGFTCSHDDREAPLVYDLLPDRWARRNPRPEAIGRLDRDTSGLLIVTDDHALAHRLSSPARHVDKTYVAELDGPLDGGHVDAFASGELVLQGETAPCRPAVLRPLAEAGTNRAEVTLREGRYHQVRRMFAAVGREVLTLHRTRFGPWSLDDPALSALSPGEWVPVELPL